MPVCKQRLHTEINGKRIAGNQAVKERYKRGKAEVEGMKSISALLYELTADEARKLPEGFQFLEYDKLYSRIRTMQKGIEHVRDDKRFVYLSYKEPPVTFMGQR